MPPTAACQLPRDLVASLLQRAMLRDRPVRLTLTGPASAGGRIQVVGVVYDLRRGRPGADDLAPTDELTVRLIEQVNHHLAAMTPPIALERILAATLV